MADKAKRLRKILLKIYMRGVLKHVKTLEEAHLVLVEDAEDPSKYTFYKKEDYIQVLEHGYTFLEDKVHFLVSSNPRNRRQVEQSIMTNKFGEVRGNIK